MSKFIINPASVSFREIREDLVNYLNSQDDSAQWSLFFQANAGSNMLDILAGIGAYLKMEAVTARRENFIQFAQNRSSVIGHSQFLGYSAYRGRNKVLKLTITPAQTQVLFKYDYVGAVRDRYLIVEQDTVLNAGVPVSFNVIIGEVLEESKVSSTSALNAFRFTKRGVSQDCRIFISGQEVEWSDTVEGMLQGKFCLQSNPFGSVDAKYLNLASFSARFSVGSEVKLKWIDLKDVDFEDSEVKLYEEYGTLDELEVVSAFQNVEDQVSITVNAPLKAETQNAVRGREDQPKIFRSLHPDILDAKGVDISSAIMKIFLLRKNGIAFTPEEKQAMQEAFSPKRPHGLLPPYIEDADASPLKLNITITLKKNSLTVPHVLVNSVLAKYRNTLKAVINLADIEDAIENDNGVKIARVTIGATPWESGKKYLLGSFVKKNSDNGKVYKVVRLRSRSGLAEPLWPTEERETINDYEIVWRAIPKSDLSGVPTWEASTFYNNGNTVRPITPNGFVYVCDDFRRHSGDVEPAWPETLGGEVLDGRLIWRSRAIEGAVSAWTPSNVYQKGEVVVPTTSVAGLMYQCVGYVGKTANTEPAFTTATNAVFNDNEVVWLLQSPDQVETALDENQYFDLTYELEVI